MSLEILPFEKVFFRRYGILMYKFQHNIFLLSISQLYAKTFSIHNHNTRSKDLLRIPHGTKTFSNVSVRIWNILVSKIDFKVSILKFKISLKLYFYYRTP